MFVFTCSHFTLGLSHQGGAKDEITEAYENRIRAFSAPEKVFGLFASVTKDGEAQMNPEDFLRALHPTRSKDAPSKRRLAAAKRLFQLVRHIDACIWIWI